ncbi:type II toxin-antitoxin system ParD family antitoxin [Granulicoccus sp. GXG6511]|uniref:type II toxin-antitoxin system ParD family antitoxin n=1 Tax=Granulicoccus sp. GXG6511 TaxID=3381351 RepID=UPI003D7ED2D3
MATRNVVLTQHQHEFVEALVTSGRYQNASEVLREGLRLLQRQEAEDAAKLTALRKSAESGWADVAAGRYTDVADDDLDTFIQGLGPGGAGTAD